ENELPAGRDIAKEELRTVTCNHVNWATIMQHCLDYSLRILPKAVQTRREMT
ncbi:hypothetical protein WUBG_02502, partial [Wuchereria bancrofti]